MSGTRERLMRCVSVALIALALALLAACAPLSGEAAQELHFETVERSDYAAYTGEFWEVEAPGIAIVAAPSDIEQLDDFITSDGDSQLRGLDFDVKFVIAAFMGIQGCAHNDFRIEQVLLRGNEFEVHAYGQGFDPQRACSPTVTSPYHVITLARAGVWEETERFTLYLNGEHAVTGSYPPVVSQATPAPTATQESIPVPTPWPTETPDLP